MGWPARPLLLALALAAALAFPGCSGTSDVVDPAASNAEANERAETAKDGNVAAEPDDAAGGEWAEIMRIVGEQLERQESLAPEDIPRAFAEARAANPDVIAWLYVPSTNVTLPVCRHPSDNGYYLYRDAAGEPSPVGAAFVEAENAPDFSDRVTVVNGHTYSDVPDLICFAELHFLLVEEAFDETEEFYVYLPDRVLTCELVSALVFNDSPILATSGYFADETVTQRYFDLVSSGGGLEGRVREGASLDASCDRIVQLTTCELSRRESVRLVVTGRVANESPLG